MFIKNFTIGADIEVFLHDEENKEIVSAEGIIQGTKDKPFVFDPTNKYYATSLDNVMCEFCIPPAKTPAEFYDAIQKALNYINSATPENLKPLAIPAAEIDSKYLQTENALLFGCDPDYNAWTEVKNLSPGTATNLRTCGGHIHIGYENPSEFFNLSLIKAMDLFIGVPSVILEPENLRKTMYGKAGAFRHKEYGVEYRTVSNFYLANKKLTDFVFNNTIAAIDFVNSGKINMLGLEEKEDIVNAINYNDHQLALKVIDQYGIKLAA